MIKKILFILIISTPLMTGQEVVNLTTPETKPNNTSYRVERITINVDNPATGAVDEGRLTVQLLGVNNEPVSCNYTNTTSPTGTFLINALNKANLSAAYAGNATTGSLKQRIYHRLVIMGEATIICGKTLTGTIAGAVP